MNIHITLKNVSAYRSYEYQVNLYDSYVKRDGKDKADIYSARPGYSEHQTGLVVDIDNGKIDYNNFESTEEFKWMEENAHIYGFILRYPYGKTNETGYMYEPWHFRYVGVDLATTLYNNGDWITLEDYFDISSVY